MSNINHTLKKYHPPVIGIFSSLLIGVIIYYLGHISGYEAKVLIKQSIGNFAMLCNTIILACTTILSLLLTALASSRSSDAKIKEDHYLGIIRLTSVVTVTFIAALFSFQLTLMPITETDNISSEYYNNYYWLTLIISSILVGCTITIGLMLRRVIIDITKVTALKDEEHELIINDEEESELRSQENDNDKQKK